MNEELLPPPIWVDKTASFRAMLAHLKDEPALAFDTESNSLYVYKEQVCLIQVSVPGTDYLIDPLALDDISGLGPLLADPGVLKVLHGAEYDVSVLHRDFGFVLVNLFDTMWASRILGWEAHGLGALLEEYFDVHMNKKYQRANWGLRPLPAAQLDYARLDTHYLLRLYDIQRRELDAQQRWPQARHRFSRLVKTRWEQKEFNPDDFWRLSGVRQLDDVGRGVLRELFLFREQQAHKENRPTFRVVSNKALVSLAEERPNQWRDLPKIKGVSHRMARRYGRDMLSAIRRGSQNPISWRERPRSNSGQRRSSRPSAADHARFEALRAWRNATAEERGVEPDIVLTNHLLWAIAQRNPRSKQDLSDEGLLAHWQVDEFGDQVLSVVKKVP
ncbi:MAG: HRDC domain-containing protein [Anaerolineae bacterium]